MSAVSGVMGILGSYFEQRAAANAAAQAEAEQAQLAMIAEQRREAAIALERQRQLFEQEKQAVLGRMIGTRVGDLEFKGATTGALQMKGLGDVARAEADAAQRPLREWMQSRVVRLRRDLEIDGRTGLFNYQAAGADPTPRYSVDTGRFETAPAPAGSTYSVDTGKVVAPPIAASSGAYSVDTGRVVAPPAPASGAYSVDTGAIVTPPSPNPNGAYSTETGRVVTPPPAAQGAYSVETGRIVTPPSPDPNGAYSVDTGRVVTPPAPASGVYSTDLGRIVESPAPPAGAYSTDTGRIVQPAADTGSAYSIDAGRRVAPPPITPDGATLTTGTGAGLTPAVTAFDGRYTGTITLLAPPGVTPTFPAGTPFMFDVVNGAPQSNWVLGNLDAGGGLTNGRSQVTLRIGPSSTIVVPIGGAFNGALNTPAGLVGSVPCGAGTCWVILAITRQTAR